MKKTHGFTLIELLVVIAIIAILAAILFPVFAKARDRANGSACMSNGKQIGLSLMQYMNDYDETYPPSRYQIRGGLTVQKRIWKDALVGYIDRKTKEERGTTSIYTCPSNENTWKYGGDETKRWPVGYALNGDIFWGDYPAPVIRRASYIKDPASFIFITETRLDAPDLNTWMVDGSGGGDWRFMPGQTTKGWYTTHTKMVNFVFCDGHAKAYRLAQTLSNPQMWNPKTAGNSHESKIQYLAPEYL